VDVVTLHQYGFDNAVASLGTSLTEEHAVLLSKYTEQVVLTYDADEAGQRAAKRAIPMLEKVGIQVKVLRMKDAKDPDEFLHKFGADRFKLLLEDCSNRVEYQLAAIGKKYNLAVDDERVRYIQETAALICTLPSPVQREIYGHRVAEIGKISYDAMKLEVGKAYKKLQAKEKKEQEKRDLAPVRNLQPKTKEFRYDNPRSAMAEEALLSMVLLEPALFEKVGNLREEMFSSSVLGRAFGQLQSRYQQGLEVSTAVLADFTSEEMSHLAGVPLRHDSTVNEGALSDCIRIILETHHSGKIQSNDDLLALQQRLRERKGMT
jgi:DNA primase